MAVTDDVILPPSIDPETRKIGIRHVSGFNEGGTRTVCQVRDFPPVPADEPDSLGDLANADDIYHPVKLVLLERHDVLFPVLGR